MATVYLRTNMRRCRRCSVCKKVLIESYRVCECVAAHVEDGSEWCVYTALRPCPPFTPEHQPWIDRVWHPFGLRA